MTRALGLTLLLFAAVFGIALLRYAPPAVRSAEAPADTFSGARARVVLRAISAGGAPRALGTDANASARTVLREALDRAGFTTEVQSTVACSRHGACAHVSNVIATRAGREPAAPAVLLMAHHDSVPCSPGASDDGLGTATVVEAARALGASAPLRRTVVVVLTDGEEAGLLGAEAFVQQHPLARTIEGAVNVDARGTSGPSAMFETSAGNGWLVDQFARHADRPVTSSLFYEIYRRMPNDTDFTVVKGFAHGVNLANIARVEHYHTPLDSFANADPGTLQHHGDQALAMIRALGEAGPELAAPHDATHDAVWFDVLATFVVRWPVSASLGLALAALALVLGWTIRLRAWGLGLAASIVALLAATVASLLVGAVLKACGAVPVPWIAHPLPALTSLHLACITAGLFAAGGLARKATPQAAWAGTWLLWGVLGVLTALVAPGASFLFVVPTLVAGLVGWLRIDVAAVVPAGVAAVLWMPLAVLVYDGLGVVVPALACVSSTLLVSTLPSLLGRERGAWDRRLGLGAGGVVLAAALAAVIAPKYSADEPQRVNVVLRQDEASEGIAPRTRVYVEAAWAYVAWGNPPEPMLRALGASTALGRGAPTPWSSPVPFAETTHVAMEGPRATVLEAGRATQGSRLRVRVESPRGARTIAVLLPGSPRLTLSVAGQIAIPRNDAVVLRAVPREGMVLDIESVTGADDAPIVLTLVDSTPGLPPDAATTAPLARAVLDARPPEATQTQEGDVTLVARRIELRHAPRL